MLFENEPPKHRHRDVRLADARRADEAEALLDCGKAVGELARLRHRDRQLLVWIEEEILERATRVARRNSREVEQLSGDAVLPAGASLDTTHAVAIDRLPASSVATRARHGRRQSNTSSSVPGRDYGAFSIGTQRPVVNRQRRLARRRRHERGVQSLFPVTESAPQLVLHVLHELIHFPLHAIHLPPHVEDDLDAGEVDAQVARQRQDGLELLQILVRVQARVAFRARRLQQPFALVEPQRLRMDVVLRGNGADHVVALAGPGFSCRHGGLLRFFRRSASSRWPGAKEMAADVGIVQPAELPQQFLRLLVAHGRQHDLDLAIRSPGVLAGARTRRNPMPANPQLPTGRRARRNAQVERAPSTSAHRHARPARLRAPPTAASVRGRDPHAGRTGDRATSIVMYRSPAGPPRAPALPRPGTAIRSPSARAGPSPSVTTSLLRLHTHALA